jgi:hypothetical protein
MAILSGIKTQSEISAFCILWAIVIGGDAIAEECHAKLFVEEDIPSNGQRRVNHNENQIKLNNN